MDSQNMELAGTLRNVPVQSEKKKAPYPSPETLLINMVLIENT